MTRRTELRTDTSWWTELTLVLIMFTINPSLCVGTEVLNPAQTVREFVSFFTPSYSKGCPPNRVGREFTQSETTEDDLIEQTTSGDRP